MPRMVSNTSLPMISRPALSARSLHRFRVVGPGAEPALAMPLLFADRIEGQAGQAHLGEKLAGVVVLPLALAAAVAEGRARSPAFGASGFCRPVQHGGHARARFAGEDPFLDDDPVPCSNCPRCSASSATRDLRDAQHVANWPTCASLPRQERLGIAEMRSGVTGRPCSTVRLGLRPIHTAVLMAKYLFTNGGFLRLAYHMRKPPSGSRMTDWLVT